MLYAEFVVNENRPESEENKVVGVASSIVDKMKPHQVRTYLFMYVRFTMYIYFYYYVFEDSIIFCISSYNH